MRSGRRSAYVETPHESTLGGREKERLYSPARTIHRLRASMAAYL